jgi:multiple sugar transport system substrate-binding protein
MGGGGDRPAAHGGALSRRAILGAAGGGAAALLAACGQTGGAQPATGGAGEAVPIDFYHRWQAEREPLMVAQVEDFHQAQKGVRVNNNLMFPYDYAKLTSMVVAGTPPDVMMIDVAVNADWAAQGMVRAVDDLLKRDRLAPKDIFYPASVRLMQYDGKSVGMPQTVIASHVLWVNSGVWQAAGLDPARLPRTWEDLLAAGQRVTRRTADGFDQIAGVFPHSVLMWATTNAVEWISEDHKKILFHTGENAARTTVALEYMTDATARLYGSQAAMEAWVKALAGPVGTGFGYAGFVTNKVAMQIEGAWQPYRFGLDAPDVKYVAGMIPFNGRNPRAKSTNLGDNGFNYAVLAGSKKVDAAWEWTKYITAGEGNPKFFRAQGRPSVVRRFNEAPDLKKLPYWDVVLKTMEQATPLPMSPAWTKVTAQIGKMATDVLGGKSAARPAVEQYARLAQDELDQAAR